MLTTGRGSTFTINCTGFGQNGKYMTVLDSVFERKAFRPAINFSIPTIVNISFTVSAILDVVSTDSLTLLSILNLFPAPSKATPQTLNHTLKLPPSLL